MAERKQVAQTTCVDGTEQTVVLRPCLCTTCKFIDRHRPHSTVEYDCGHNRESVAIDFPTTRNTVADTLYRNQIRSASCADPGSLVDGPHRVFPTPRAVGRETNLLRWVLDKGTILTVEPEAF